MDVLSVLPTQSQSMARDSKNEEDKLSFSRSFRVIQLGVWRVWIETDSYLNPRVQWKNFTSSIRVRRQLLLDIYQLGPVLLLLLLLSDIWTSLEPLFLLHLSSRVLFMVSSCIF